MVLGYIELEGWETTLRARYFGVDELDAATTWSLPPIWAIVLGMFVRERLMVGTPIIVTSESGSQPLGAVFEDDGDTGYFYAVRLLDHKILDAVPRL